MSRGSLKDDDNESEATSRASSAADLQASPDYASRMAAGATASTSGRTGIPTKVMLHKKSNKQYSNLAVVQELFAHTGQHFHRNAYLAAASPHIDWLFETVKQRSI